MASHRTSTNHLAAAIQCNKDLFSTPPSNVALVTKVLIQIKKQKDIFLVFCFFFCFSLLSSLLISDGYRFFFPFALFRLHIHVYTVYYIHTIYRITYTFHLFTCNSCMCTCVYVLPCTLFLRGYVGRAGGCVTHS